MDWWPFCHARIIAPACVIAQYGANRWLMFSMAATIGASVELMNNSSLDEELVTSVGRARRWAQLTTTPLTGFNLRHSRAVCSEMNFVLIIAHYLTVERINELSVQRSNTAEVFAGQSLSCYRIEHRHCALDWSIHPESNGVLEPAHTRLFKQSIDTTRPANG